MIAIASMTQIARYDRNSDYARHYGTPGTSNDSADMTADPVMFDVPYRPVGGIRAVVARLVNHNMPSVPLGPAKVIAHRAERRAGQPAQMPYRPASVYTPVQGVQQTSPWWDDGSGIDRY